jgi:hypothetical protein
MVYPYQQNLQNDSQFHSSQLKAHPVLIRSLHVMHPIICLCDNIRVRQHQMCPLFAWWHRQVEKIQREGARFIKSNYTSKDSGCVTRMLKELKAITLQEPRKKLCRIILCKVVEGLILGIPVTLLKPLDLNEASLRNNSVIVKQWYDFYPTRCVFSIPSPRLGDRKYTTRWIKIISYHKPWEILYLSIFSSIHCNTFWKKRRIIKTKDYLPHA